MKRLKKGRVQILKYSAFFAWYLRDVVRLFRHRLLLIVLANLIGISFQANAVLLGYKYARSLEKGTVIELAGWSMNPRTSVALLAGTAVAVLFLILASSLLIMRARLGAIRLGREYGDFCSQRTYLLASRLPSGVTPAANEELTPARIAQLARRDSQLCALTLRIIIFALLPAGTVIVAGVAMFIVDPWLSMVVLSILAAISLRLYRISVEGARERSLIERRVRELPRERKRLMDRVSLVPAPIAIDDDFLKAPYRNGALALFGDTLENQRRVLERSFVTAQAAMGVAVFLVLLIQGGATLRDEGNWSSLIVYLVILSLFSTSFAKTVRAMTSVNRFYPTISRYARFVKNAGLASEVHAPSTAANEYRVVTRLITQGEEGIEDVLHLEGHTPVAVILEGAVSRYMMRPLVEQIRVLNGDRSGPLPQPIWFASGRSLVAGISMRDASGLSSGCSTDALAEELNRLGERETASRLPQSLDEPLTETQIAELGAGGALLVACLGGRGSNLPVRVIDAAGLAALGPEARAALLKDPRSRLTFVAYTPDSLDRLGQFGESTLLIADDEAVYGYCSVEAARVGDPAVRRLLARLRAKARSRQPVEFMEMEEEEGIV